MKSTQSRLLSIGELLSIRAGAQKARSLNDVTLSFFGCHGTFLYLVAVSGVVGSSTLVNIHKLVGVGRYPYRDSLPRGRGWQSAG